MTATATRPTCEATVRWQPGEYREEPVACGQSVGLRTIVAADGTTHHACGRWGHLAAVAAKVERMGRRTTP